MIDWLHALDYEALLLGVDFALTLAFAGWALYERDKRLTAEAVARQRQLDLDLALSQRDEYRRSPLESLAVKDAGKAKQDAVQQRRDPFKNAPTLSNLPSTPLPHKRRKRRK